VRQLRDRLAAIKLQLEALNGSHDGMAELASRCLNSRKRWLATVYGAKRRILEIDCLNLTLDGATPVAEMRKPFDALAEGLHSKESTHMKTKVSTERADRSALGDPRRGRY
jgi:site-specific DNA recombinase